MQLKFNFFIIVYLLVFVSCQNNKEEESKVIAVIYASISKELPRPPNPTGNHEIPDSIVNKIDYNNLKPLIFNYAINENFINFEINNVSRKFKLYNSKELPRAITIDENEFVLIEKLDQQDYSKKLDKDEISKISNYTILFSDKQFLDEINDNLDGIISFSRVSFNKEYNMAVVGVGIYRSGLDSNLKLYILEKSNDIWEIKSYQVIEYS